MLYARGIVGIIYYHAIQHSLPSMTLTSKCGTSWIKYDAYSIMLLYHSIEYHEYHTHIMAITFHHDTDDI